MFRRLILLVLPLLLLPLAAWAMADHMTTPLVVIRFNQPRVYYEQPLYTAMNRALQAKPEVRFNVIHYFPPRPALKAQGDRQFQRVLGTIRQMGMPEARLNITSQADAALNYSEVHIYVR
jgi:hypothetical protein